MKEYKEKENRKNKIWNNKEVDAALEKMFELLKAKKNKEAKTQLEKVFKKLADLAESNWKFHQTTFVK